MQFEWCYHSANAPQPRRNRSLRSGTIDENSRLQRLLTQPEASVLTQREANTPVRTAPCAVMCRIGRGVWEATVCLL
ncbi:unnamed protein product [Staurois parvus]|uniref:Uncharacterized protein n=1 Tax=Staurois parvus TaxID=386267 RepID=A0ABN9BH03_9NEOB|nr:unnamed protein product [Staurois parvus]